MRKWKRGRRFLFFIRHREEFASGEVRGILLDLLADCLERQEPDTRSQEILKSILEENKKADRQENRKSPDQRLLKVTNLSHP